MRGRPGFTLLEAAVAMTVISLVAIGAMAALSGSLRASARAQAALPAPALAQERLGALELADPERLRMLPDSLSHGEFGPPYDGYRWRAESKPVRGEPTLVELTVHIEWPGGAYALTQRRYRPSSTIRLAGVIGP